MVDHILKGPPATLMEEVAGEPFNHASGTITVINSICGLLRRQTGSRRKGTGRGALDKIALIGIDIKRPSHELDPFAIVPLINLVTIPALVIDGCQEGL